MKRVPKAFPKKILSDSSSEEEKLSDHKGSEEGEEEECEEESPENGYHDSFIWDVSLFYYCF